MGWEPGTVIVRREVAWGRPWLAIAERVVEDRDGLFVTYVPPGAPLGYGAGPWPTANGFHPWYPKPAWSGRGTLIAQQPGDAYAVQHFWSDAGREFERWYVNLQDPMRRTAIGYDTDDHELDLVVWADGRIELKDDDAMEQRVREGRYTAAEVVEFRALAAALAAIADAGDGWWSSRWTGWEPDPAWGPVALVDGWELVRGS